MQGEAIYLSLDTPPSLWRELDLGQGSACPLKVIPRWWWWGFSCEPAMLVLLAAGGECLGHGADLGGTLQRPLQEGTGQHRMPNCGIFWR